LRYVYLTLFRSCAPKMNYISSAFPKHSLMNCRYIFLMVFLTVNFLKAQHLPGKYHPESKTYKAADSSYSSDFFEDGFARFYHRGRVGIMESSGRIILSAKYDKIFDFRNNIAKVCEEGHCGLADRKGNIILPPENTELRDSSEQCTVFKDLNSGLYGLVSDDGKIIVPAKYSKLHAPKQGISIFTRHKTLGLLLMDGKESIFDSHFDLQNHPDIRTYENKLFVKGIYLESSGYGLVCMFIQKGDKTLFGFIDKDAKWVIEPKYERIMPFNEQGISIVIYEGKWGAIDTSGKTVEPFKFDSFEKLREKLNPQPKEKPQKESKKTEYATITAIADHNRTYTVFNDYRIALKNGKWGILDSNSRPITKFIYDAIVPLDSATVLLSWHISSYSLNTGIPRYVYNGRYTFMDKSGKISKRERSFSKTIQGVADFHRDEFTARNPFDYAPQAVEGQYSYYPIERRPKLSGPDADFDMEEIVFEGFRIVSYNKDEENKNKFGFHHFVNYSKGLMDASGKLLIPAEYDNIISDGSPRLIVMKKTTPALKEGALMWKYGVIDVHGKVIIPLGDYIIEALPNAYIVMREIKPYEWESAIFDLCGKEIIPFIKKRYKFNDFGQWLTDEPGAKVIERKE
jgi:hypothetical protein